MKRYSINKFMAKNPRKIGKVLEVTFYEHPVYGEDVGLVAVWNCMAFQTHFYDLPNFEDVRSFISDMRVTNIYLNRPRKIKKKMRVYINASIMPKVISCKTYLSLCIFCIDWYITKRCYYNSSSIEGQR